MKVKANKSRWFYKKGDVIEVDNGKQMCQNVLCYTHQKDGKTFYVHPDDVEEVNNDTKKPKKIDNI